MAIASWYCSRSMRPLRMLQLMLLALLSIGGALCRSAQHSTSAGSAATAQQQSLPVEPPIFCVEQPYVGADQPSCMRWGGNLLKVYRNLYRHAGRWYAAVTPAAADAHHDSQPSSTDAELNSNCSIDRGMSLNNQLSLLPVVDIAAFQRNVKVRLPPTSSSAIAACDQLLPAHSCCSYCCNSCCRFCCYCCCFFGQQ
jgi:hypothetical protein